MRGLPGSSPLTRFDIVAFAASLGGPSAYAEVIPSLPANFNVPVLIVQHRSSSFEDRLAHLLARRSRLPVVDARDGVPLKRGVVYVGPAADAMVVDEAGILRHTPLARGAKPGNVLFESIASAYGAASIGVVLTGSMDDAARGVRAIKAAGGRVVVQSPATAQASGMPLAALASGCVDHVLPLRAIAPALTSLVLVPGAADLLTARTPHWAF